MRLFYADPGLRDNTGHHLNLCQNFLAEAKALGVETAVLASKGIDHGRAARQIRQEHSRRCFCLSDEAIEQSRCGFTT